MVSPQQRAQSRSHLYQLLAMSFSHPTEEFHQHLVDGSFSEAVTHLLEILVGTPGRPLNYQQDFIGFEAQHIELFVAGHKGRPAVGLCAGDHAPLMDGLPRPRFMLDYVSWYRHFGVKPRVESSETELPDHLACQLEFMALLAHMESEEDAESSLSDGYRAAQRDFLERHLQPFLRLLNPAIAHEVKHRECSNVFTYFADITHDIGAHSLHEFNSCLTRDSNVKGVDSVKEQTESGVSLWT